MNLAASSTARSSEMSGTKYLQAFGADILLVISAVIRASHCAVTPAVSFGWKKQLKRSHNTPQTLDGMCGET